MIMDELFKKFGNVMDNMFIILSLSVHFYCVHCKKLLLSNIFLIL